MARGGPIPATIREPLRRVLAARLASRARDGGAGTPASILVPLFARDGEVWVWLVRRTERMARHAGQVAFPGGKRDPGDESAMHAALREVEEELGFPRDEIEVDGRLEDQPTITGYVVTPFVGWVPGAREPRPNPIEIARAFAAPLAVFVHQTPRPRPLRGRGLTRLAPSWEVDGELVWGATARIMSGFVAVVRAALRAT